MKNFTMIDLFAGIGGNRIGFESIGGTCVYTSEWDKWAQQMYTANFSCDHALGGDISKVDATKIPDFDVLLGGFPCQPFSLAGVSKNNSLGREHGFMHETQGTLFFDIARIIDEKKPKAFMLENVKNLVSHDKGNTFRVIIKTLEELGYHVHHKIIDARHWVPQHRERIFIVGFREPNDFTFDNFVVPKGGPKLSTVLETDVDEKYTLSDKLWNYLQNYSAKHAAAGNGFGFGLVGPDDVARTLSARYYKDGSEILVKRGEGQNPRRLTPRECCKLMGYPEDMVINLSDTQAYKRFGNGVCVPVVKAIAEHMKAYL